MSVFAIVASWCWCWCRWPVCYARRRYHNPPCSLAAASLCIPSCCSLPLRAVSRRSVSHRRVPVRFDNLHFRFDMFCLGTTLFVLSRFRSFCYDPCSFRVLFRFVSLQSISRRYVHVTFRFSLSFCRIMRVVELFFNGHVAGHRCVAEHGPPSAADHLLPDPHLRQRVQCAVPHLGTPPAAGEWWTELRDQGGVITSCMAVPVCDGVYHTPRPIFRGRYLHGPSRVGAETVGVGIMSPRAAEDVSFGNDTLLVVEQSSFAKPRRGGVTRNVTYGSRMAIDLRIPIMPGCARVMHGRSFYLFYFFYFVLRWMGKNKSLSSHTLTYQMHVVLQFNPTLALRQQAAHAKAAARSVGVSTRPDGCSRLTTDREGARWKGICRKIFCLPLSHTRQST